MHGIIRLKRDFFMRDVLDVAPGLLSKVLAIRSDEWHYKEVQYFGN